MPSGRFVSGVTQTSVGEVAVIGICIPWFGSRTEARRGNERRRRWQDHEEYLAGLTEVLERVEAKRLIVMGDFNQVIGPGGRARRELRLALQEAFNPNLRIADVGSCLPGTQEHRPRCAERGLGRQLGGCDQQHPREEETLGPFRRRRRRDSVALELKEFEITGGRGASGKRIGGLIVIGR